MTREQRWIREQEENAARTVALAEQLEEALGTADLRERRAELQTIRNIRAMVDSGAAPHEGAGG